MLPVYPAYSIASPTSRLSNATNSSQSHSDAYASPMTSSETKPLFTADESTSSSSTTSSPRVADLVIGFETVHTSPSSCGEGGIAASREISRSRHSLSPATDVCFTHTASSRPVMQSFDDTTTTTAEQTLSDYTVDSCHAEDDHLQPSPLLSNGNDNSISTPETPVAECPSLVAQQVPISQLQSTKTPLLDDNENLTNGHVDITAISHPASVASEPSPQSCNNGVDLVDLSLPADTDIRAPLVTNGNHPTTNGHLNGCADVVTPRTPPVDVNGAHPGTCTELTDTKRTLQAWAIEYNGVQVCILLLWELSQH